MFSSGKKKVPGFDQSFRRSMEPEICLLEELVTSAKLPILEMKLWTAENVLA